MTSEMSRRIGRETVRQLGIDGDIHKISEIPYETLLAAGTSAVAEVRKQVEAEGVREALLFSVGLLP